MGWFTTSREKGDSSPLRPLIAVVDDDVSVRESLPELLRELGFGATAFGSAEAFLAPEAGAGFGCLILDVSLPGMSGPDLQLKLGDLKRNIPIIFITGKPDPAVRAGVLAQGATACLIKPFSEDALRAALDSALGAH
jgi:FixJ family two-component response regulator